MADVAEIFKPWSEKILRLERESEELKNAIKFLIKVIGEHKEIKPSFGEGAIITYIKDYLAEEEKGGGPDGSRGRKGEEAAGSFWLGREARIRDAAKEPGSEDCP